MLEYKDAKAVIDHVDDTGKNLMEFTTWRGDFIEQILKGGNCLHSVQEGDKITIVININKISKPEDRMNAVDNSSTVGC